MRTIWKFPLLGQRTVLQLPRGAQVLTVAMQEGAPCLWAEIPDTRAPTVDFTVRIYGTGHELPPSWLSHLATFMDGPFVLHAYREMP